MKYLDNMGEDDPNQTSWTGVPLVYEFDETSSRSNITIWATRKRSRRKPAAVANQGKAK
ncbi:hypothetical protein MJ575_09475 [Klebsiella pneumoniae]|nr:hypothetical protein MJ575_09475 [Klebsiella pneumoniae]